MRRDENLKRITFDLIRDGTQDSQSNLAIVGTRRENNCRPASGLSMASLRIQGNPDSITAMGNI